MTTPTVDAPRVWLALGLIALYAAVQILVSGILSLVPALLRGLGAGGIGHTAQRALAAPGGSIAIAMLAATSAAVVVVWQARRRWHALWAYATPPGLGLHRPYGHWLALALGVGLIAPVAGGLLTHWLAGGHEVMQNVRQLAHDAPMLGHLALATVAVIVAPLAEELMFRGVLLSALIPRLGVRTAAVVTALAFAALHMPGLHWQWFALPQLVVLGLVLAWLRLHCRSLWPAILAHATHNALALGAWSVAFSVLT